MLTSILIASANRYICTIPTLYSQLVIIPLAHELQFLHWKKSASPNWYWFFRQPHTVSCFWVHGVFSICCNSEERNEKWLYHPYLQLRPLLWQQVLLALNLPTGEKKKKNKQQRLQTASQTVVILQILSLLSLDPFPYTVPCTHSATFFPGLLTHLAIPSRLSPTTTTHFPQGPRITHLYGTVYTGSIFPWCCQQLWMCH